MHILLTVFLGFLPGIIHQSATSNCPTPDIVCNPGEVCSLSVDCIPLCRSVTPTSEQSCEDNDDCLGEAMCSAAHFCFLPCFADTCAAGCPVQ